MMCSLLCSFAVAARRGYVFLLLLRDVLLLLLLRAAGARSLARRLVFFPSCGGGCRGGTPIFAVAAALTHSSLTRRFLWLASCGRERGRGTGKSV